MREQLFQQYANNIAEFLALSTNEDKEKLRSFIVDFAKKTMDIPVIENVVRQGGDLKLKQTKLTQFITSMNENSRIISPSGSVYIRPSEKRSLISEFEAELKRRRKVAKNAMFAAMEKNLDVLASNYNYQQANAKIKANAVSGVMNALWNLFRDIGNYNAITSIARTVVALSASIIEQFSGGRFSFFTFDELINHVVLCRRNRPGNAKIYECVDKFDLMIPTVEDVSNFLCDALYPYYIDSPRPALFDKTYNLVSKLDEADLIYIYYYNNLVHLFQKNESVFRPIIDHIMTGDVVQSPGQDPKNIRRFDDEMLSIITICNKAMVGSTPISDLIKENPELVNKLVDIGTHYEVYIGKLDILFETFVYTNWIPPNLNNIKDVLKSAILLLDTDSNIFTTLNWVKWYSKDVYSDHIDNYYIHSLVVYLICKNVANILNKFAVNLGVDAGDVGKLMMKNEFLYPALMILDVKKNYTGLITIQEGMPLKKPKLDIKGVVLRSSSICKTSTEWFKTFLNELFAEGIKKRINGYELILKVVDFENQIRHSLERQEITFLKYTSIRTYEQYALPTSSSYVYADAWNILFGETSSDILLPTKCALVKVIEPTDTYLTSVRETNEPLYNNFLKFEEKYGKYFTTLALHPLADKIPAEIVPIIDMRSIIYHNVAPAYIILKSIGLGVGYKKKTALLYSDMYK